MDERASIEAAIAGQNLLSCFVETAAKRESEIARISGEKREIDFGNQIRSYVLHPYRMAKDHRTGLETSAVDAVLDGGLDEFIEAFLRYSARQRD